MLFIKKIALFFLLLSSTSFGFQSEQDNEFNFDSAESKQFKLRCNHGVCKVTATMHRMSSAATAFVPLLPKEYQDKLGGKMLAIASGHQFDGWSKEVQAAGFASISLSFLLNDRAEHGHRQSLLVDAVYQSHKLNRKDGDYAILLFEPTKELSSYVRPIDLAQKGTKSSREDRFYAPAFPNQVFRQDCCNAMQQLPSDFRGMEQRGVYDKSKSDVEAIMATNSYVAGASGGPLIKLVNAKPVVIGSCMSKIGTKENPYSVSLGHGLTGRQAHNEFQNKLRYEGIFTTYLHVDMVHNALEEYFSQLE